MFKTKTYKIFTLLLVVILFLLTTTDSFMQNVSVEIAIQRAYYVKVILLLIGFFLLYRLVPGYFNNNFRKAWLSYLFSAITICFSVLLFYMAGQSIRFNILTPAISEEVYFIPVKSLAIFSNDYKNNREKLYPSQREPEQEYSVVIYNDSVIGIDDKKYYDTFFFRYYQIDSSTEFRVLNGFGGFLILRDYIIEIPKAND